MSVKRAFGFVPLLVVLAILAACESPSGSRPAAPESRPTAPAPGPAATDAATPGTATVGAPGGAYDADQGVQPGIAARTTQAVQDLPTLRIDRVSTIAPWPRGIAFADGKAFVLARGRHRNYGGPAPEVQDLEATLFEIDPMVREPYVPGELATARIANNGRILAEPDPSVVHLYDRSKPVLENWVMDRPFCTLAFDPQSDSFFLCAFSGVDLPGKDGGPPFRKNATDGILRFDRRTRRWAVVERHRHDVVPRDEQSTVVPNQYYPHHDPQRNAPPHGWLNGPNGCAVIGRWLYAVGKDNHTLARYDLAPIRRSADAGAPPSEFVLGSEVDVRLDGRVQRLKIQGHSAVARSGGHLYLATRTSSVVLRFPITADGDLVRPIVGELVAEFEPYSKALRRSADLWEMVFDQEGRAYVSCSRTGRVWRFRPDPARPFDGNDGREVQPTANQPFLDLRKITGNKKAVISNMVVAPDGSLYFCAAMPEEGRAIAGAIFRAVDVSSAAAAIPGRPAPTTARR